MSLFAQEPIMNIQWEDAQLLRPNGWNPNVVFTPELRLLEHSILTTGWVQPVLINSKSLIIDGFHRWTLSMKSDPIKARYRGQVPCCILPLNDPQAMMLTVRINRAKGQHAAVRMSDLVMALVHDHGYSKAAVAKGIGASMDEVELLLCPDVFVARDLKNAPYSRAWVPRETGHEP